MYLVKIATIEDIQNSKNHWNELAAQMPLPSIFCTWEWIYTWWEHFGKSYNPLILFVFKGNELKGILPLAYLKKSNLFRGRILNYCGSIELFPDHLDVISSKDDVEECILAILQFLTCDYTAWDVLQICHLSENSKLIDVLSNNKKPHDIKKISVSPYISLNEGFDGYLRQFTKKHFERLHRLRNRLHGKFNVQFNVCNNGMIETESALEDLFELHLARKESAGMASTFSSNAIHNFHYDFVKRVREKGWIRLISLKKDNHAIAVGYGFIIGKRFNYFQSGLDPSWEKHSVGSILLMEIIENACSDGCVEIDLLRGDEAYKSKWTQTSRNLYLLKFYNENLGGKFLMLQTHINEHLKRNLKGLLPMVHKLQ